MMMMITIVQQLHLLQLQQLHLLQLQQQHLQLLQQLHPSLSVLTIYDSIINEYTITYDILNTDMNSQTSNLTFDYSNYVSEELVQKQVNQPLYSYSNIKNETEKENFKKYYKLINKIDNKLTESENNTIQNAYLRELNKNEILNEYYNVVIVGGSDDTQLNNIKKHLLNNVNDWYSNSPPTNYITNILGLNINGFTRGERINTNFNYFDIQQTNKIYSNEHLDNIDQIKTLYLLK